VLYNGYNKKYNSDKVNNKYNKVNKYEPKYNRDEDED
jgi:hypothetical protein